jgi:hypothetical protein
MLKLKPFKSFKSRGLSREATTDPAYERLDALESEIKNLVLEIDPEVQEQNLYDGSYELPSSKFEGFNAVNSEDPDEIAFIKSIDLSNFVDKRAEESQRENPREAVLVRCFEFEKKRKFSDLVSLMQDAEDEREALAEAEARARKTVPYAWDDEISTDDEVSAMLNFLVSAKEEKSTLKVPGDLRTIWPKGYAVLERACIRHGLQLMESQATLMVASGYKDSTIFKSANERKAYFEQYKDAEQVSIGTLPALIAMTEHMPDELMLKGGKTAAVAVFALHSIAIESSDEYEKSLLQKSLKQPDGGRKMVFDRIKSRFAVSYTAATLLFETCETLIKKNAKSFIEKKKLSKDLLSNIREFCFTTPSGLLQNFCRTVTRKEQVLSQVLEPNGKSFKTVKSEKLVRGHDIPLIKTADDTLTVGEVESAILNEKSFNNHSTVLRNVLALPMVDRRNNAADPARVADIIIQNSYRALHKVSLIRKDRRKRIADLAPKDAKTDKISKSSWRKTSDEVLANMPASNTLNFADLVRDRKLYISKELTAVFNLPVDFDWHPIFA